MIFVNIPENWRGETDVIVVGAGNAGLPAAIVTADRGARVIVLEASASPSSSLSWASGHCFAGTDMQKELGVEDSPDKLCDEAVKITGGSPLLWKEFADKQLETYQWVKGLVGKPVALTGPSPHSVARIHRFEGTGAALYITLRKMAEEKGIRILFQHRAQRLIVNPETGRVIGIRVRHGSETLNFRAARGVILACGGFLQNARLVQEFGPEASGCVPAAPKTHQGDGLIMALDIGAATSGIAAAATPSLSMCAETGHTMHLWSQGPITVNPDGKRWADEVETPYNILFRDLLQKYPDGRHVILYDSKIRAKATEDFRKIKEYQADTIEELSRLISVDTGTLTGTVNQYNSDIDSCGFDRQYDRKLWGGRRGKESVPKIDAPPFYAVKCYVSLTSAKGGIKINPKTQVVDVFNDVIPGLYAAGEITGGLFQKPNIYLPGILTVASLVFGRIAGEEAARQS